MKYSKKFEAYLNQNGIVLTNKLISLSDANRASYLYVQFKNEEAKKQGLPKELKPYAKEVINFHLYRIDRAGQDPEKYGVKLINSEKNYDNNGSDGTWNGHVNFIAICEA